MPNHFLDNIKNILMLKILKWNHLLLYLKRRLWNCICFKKPKVKQKRINTVVCCLHKRKDVKRNVKKRIGESFLELIYFIFYMSLKNNTSLRLSVGIVCSLLFYLCLVRSSHWEVFVQIKPNSWTIPVKVFIVIKVAGCRPLAFLKLTLSHMF